MSSGSSSEAKVPEPLDSASATILNPVRLTEHPLRTTSNERTTTTRVTRERA